MNDIIERKRLSDLSRLKIGETYEVKWGVKHYGIFRLLEIKYINEDYANCLFQALIESLDYRGQGVRSFRVYKEHVDMKAHGYGDTVYEI